jgi:hypothetical protein
MSYNIELDDVRSRRSGSSFEGRKAPGYSDHHHEAPLTRPVCMNERFSFTPYM